MSAQENYKQIEGQEGFLLTSKASCGGASSVMSLILSKIFLPNIHGNDNRGTCLYREIKKRDPVNIAQTKRAMSTITRKKLKF